MANTTTIHFPPCCSDVVPKKNAKDCVLVFIFCNRDLRSRFVDGANALFRCFLGQPPRVQIFAWVGLCLCRKALCLPCDAVCEKGEKSPAFRRRELSYAYRHTRALARAGPIFAVFFCVFFCSRVNKIGVRCVFLSTLNKSTSALIFF